MDCAVYKSQKKTNYYLFVESKDNFEKVPESLINMLGKLEWVMCINLDEREKLSQADPKEVKQQIMDQGYFLQLPADQLGAGANAN